MLSHSDFNELVVGVRKSATRKPNNDEILFGLYVVLLCVLYIFKKYTQSFSLLLELTCTRSLVHNIWRPTWGTRSRVSKPSTQQICMVRSMGIKKQIFHFDIVMKHMPSIA